MYLAMGGLLERTSAKVGLRLMGTRPLRGTRNNVSRPDSRSHRISKWKEERYDPLWSRVIRGFLLRIYLGGALWSRHETFWKNCIEVTSKKACVQPNTTIYWLYQLTFESSTDMRIELLANSSDSHGPPAIFCGLRICPIESTFLHSERVLL